jgi:hypothetical protein
MSIITTANFEQGKFKTGFTQFTANDLTACITRNEDKIMTELLGKDLYALYVTGVAGGDPIYEFLRDAFIEEINEVAYVSQGVVDMLCGFVWCEYQRDIYANNSSIGANRLKGENSDQVSFNGANYHSRYLEALSTFEAIQAYINDNLDVYPTFNGVCKYPYLQF